MNTTLCVLMLCVGGGPFSSAINHSAPSAAPLPLPAVAPPESAPNFAWQEAIVGSTAIELPLLTPVAYERTAPANYRAHSATKTVALWCPQHGWRCGMQQTVEDTLNHLQTVHGVTLEHANEIGRDKWLSYHDDLHWCEETPERQAAFLHPSPAKPAASVCGPGGCPTTNYGTRGIGRRGGGFF